MRSTIVSLKKLKTYLWHKVRIIHILNVLYNEILMEDELWPPISGNMFILVQFEFRNNRVTFRLMYSRHLCTLDTYVL